LDKIWQCHLEFIYSPATIVFPLNVSVWCTTFRGVLLCGTQFSFPAPNITAQFGEVILTWCVQWERSMINLQFSTNIWLHFRSDTK